MAYKIQPLGIGGILDQAISITKDHFGLLFGIMLMLLIPYSVIMGLTMVSILPQTSMFPTMEENAEVQAALLRFWPLFVANFFISFFLVMPLTSAAVIWAVARLYLGQPVTAVEAMRQALRRLLPLLGTTILMNVVILIGLILCILPGVIAALFFGLSHHVVMIENIAGFAALKRSAKLVLADFGTFFVLGLLVFIILIACNTVAFIPQPHVRAIVQTLAYAFATIIGTAAGVVFYFSARCRKENFDLHYLADSIGVAPAVADETIPAR